VGQLGQIVLAADERVALRRKVSRDRVHRHPQVADANDARHLFSVRRRSERRAPRNADLEELDR
jgi:hypothetical protein